MSTASTTTFSNWFFQVQLTLYVGRNLTSKKTLVLCLSCIDNAFSTGGYDSIIVELELRSGKKDYFLRVVSNLCEDVLNERKLVSKKLNNLSDGTLFLQYF